MKSDAPSSFSTWLKVILIPLALLSGLASLGVERGSLDESVTAYVGRAILRGEVLYRDVWDIRGPGIFFLNAGVIFLFGKSDISLRVFELAWQCCTAFALARLGRRIFPNRGASWLPAALYLILYYGSNSWSWGEPEGWLLLPLVVSAQCILRATADDRLRDWFLGALALGIVCLLKLPFGVLGIACLVMATRLRRAEAGRTAPSRIGLRWAALAAGIAIPLLACVLVFAAQGALRELYEAQSVGAPAYLAHVRSTTSLWEFLRRLRQPLLLPWFLFAATLPLLWQRWRELVRAGSASGAILLLAWIAVAAIVPAVQRETTMYRFIPLLAPLILFGSYLVFQPALESAEGQRQGLRVAAAVIGIAILVLPLRNAAAHASYTLGFSRRPPELEQLLEVAAWLRQHTRETDRILVWGNEPIVYLAAERRAACPVLSTSFVHLPEIGPGLRQECMRRLKSSPPPFIVHVTSSQFGNLPAGGNSFEEFLELREFARNHYDVERATPRYTLYRRREADAAQP